MVLVSSCSKEEEKKEVNSPEFGKITITGRLRGDLILNNGQLDPIKGVKVTARINVADLVSVGSVTAPGLTRTYESTTNDDGIYTLEVEAANKPVAVSLEIPQTINLDQTLENGTTEKRTFNRTTNIANPVTLSRGQVHVQNADYNYNAIDAKGLVTLEGTVSFRNDLCKGISLSLDSQISVVPANTMLRITWTDDNFNAREVIVKTDANGKFTLSVETSQNSKTLTVRGIKFYADRKSDVDSDGDCDTENNYGYTTATLIFTINKGDVNKEKIIFN